MGSAGRSRSSSSDQAVREACRFLEIQVKPALEPTHEGPLVRAIQDAVHATDLSVLGRLPERQRRRLLGAMEDRLAKTRAAPSPQAVVVLTSALAPLGRMDDSSGRQLAPPGR